MVKRFISERPFAIALSSMKNILLTLGILLLFQGTVSATQVAIKAEASKDYLKERARDENKKIQTYQFMKGRHFKGRSRDKSVEEVDFNDIIQDLAQQLAKQDYYPNPVLGKGDLLIMVHYGATDFEDDPLELQGITRLEDISNLASEELEIGSTAAFDFSGSLNAALGLQQSMNSGGQMTRYQKATMLGIELPDDERAGFIYMDYDKDQILREPRYFVVLMAYDYTHLREYDETKLLWSTRYSVRTTGHSFDTAFREMNAVASDYFGKDFGKLTRKRFDDKSRVEIGDIEVIENSTIEDSSTNEDR